MDARRPRVVIVGAGFAGLEAAKALRRSPVDVLVVDRRNHHLFQPLLYQVATAALSPADIAAPIRKILRAQRNTRVLLGEASEVRPDERGLVVDGTRIDYDFLVLAAGATHSYFAHPEWERQAPGLKTIEDATEIRRRFLLAFEAAENEPDPVARAAAMTFVVVGGGPTGVELAGAMAEVARTVLPGDFRTADPRQARVVLVEGQERVLATMPLECSQRALEQLRELGVEVHTSANVTQIDADGVVAGGERIASRTVLWAAGVRASPLGRSLGAALDKAGRVIVRSDLTIEGHPEVFVIGDQAAVVDPRSKALVPGVAPAAIQMGRFAGRAIAREVEAVQAGLPNGKRGERGAFHYVDKGTLATIGRSRAVADIHGRHVSGFIAWLLWAGVHILYLIQFRNRVFVMLGWLWGYIFYDRGARLITGPTASEERAR
jgi:NADH dehydrogenase